jgi:hypothetical protein
MSLLIAAVLAASQPPALTDERVYQLASESAWLKSKLSDLLLSDSGVLRRFEGAGFEPACAAMWRGERRLDPSFEARFKPMLVAATRKIVPEEKLRAARFPGFEHNAVTISYKPLVRNEIDRTAEPLYAEAHAELRTLFSEELAVPRSLPEAGPVGGDHPGATSLQVWLACMMYFSKNRAAILNEAEKGAH